MKILHLVSRSHRRGAEMAALDLAGELDALGHEDKVLALATAYDGRHDPEMDCLLPRPGLGPAQVPALAVLLRRELRRRPVDVVVLHGGFAALVSAVARLRPGPLLVWQRILSLPDDVWIQPRRRLWEAVANRTDAAVALTVADGVELRRLGFPGPIRMIRNSRRPDRFLTADRESGRRWLRAETGGSGEDVHLIGFVGHLVEQKQPVRALAVLQGVLDAGVRARLVVAGDGPLRDALEREVASRGLRRHVTLLGHRNDVERVYAGVDLLVLTSDAEGIPGVAIEAQMGGCPVVSFPLGGIADVVEDGRTGLVLDAPDTGLMAGAVAGLLRDGARRAEMGRAARERAQRFSAEGAAPLYDRYFTELRRPPAAAPGVSMYWYWPFAREEDIDRATGAMRDGDSLVVETLDRPGVPTWGPTDPYVVLNDIPEVHAASERTIRWAVSRAGTYVSRVVRRRRTLRRCEFDIVHVMFPNRFTDAIDLALLRRRHRLVCSVHDVYPHQLRLPLRMERWLLGLQYRNSGHLVVHSDRLRELLVQDFGIDRSMIEVVPHAVTRHPPVPGVEPDQPPMVLFFGTLRRNKGVEVLVDAIRRVDADVRFHFAGRGADDVEALVRRLAATDERVDADVEWIDVNRKAELFRRSSLVVLPYTSFESESGVLHDAYGHAKPVVVSDVGALGPAVRADGTGWVVPPGDADALAAAIVAALADPAAHRAAAAAAAAVAEAKRPAVAGARLRELYERILCPDGHP